MTRYQDDFYDAINGEWEKTAVIPADKSRTGGFIDLDEEIEELMLATTDKWLAGEDVPEDAILANFVKYHRMVRDFDKRDADGIKPVLPLLKEYQDLESFADFTSKLAAFELAGKPNFLPFGVSPDFMDARTNVLWASAPGTILPDTTYYAEDHPQREELLGLWKESSANLLKAYDLAVRMTNRATGHIAMILEEQYGFELFTLTSFAPFIETKLENMGGFICR